MLTEFQTIHLIECLKQL